jgi:hypothetical protein
MAKKQARRRTSSAARATNRPGRAARPSQKPGAARAKSSKSLKARTAPRTAKPTRKASRPKARPLPAGRRSAAKTKTKTETKTKKVAKPATKVAKATPPKTAVKKSAVKASTAAKTTAKAVKKAGAPALPRPSRQRMAPSLNRSRRHLPEIEDNVPTPPSSLDLDRTPSAARSGRQEMRESILEHNETGPELTGGDVDASWEDAYAVGDEAPGGDNPTPDQDRVDDIGRALGVEYQDNEELKASEKISDRDKHRWELDPASSEDYRDRD